jgi:hypothetical protein
MTSFWFCRRLAKTFGRIMGAAHKGWGPPSPMLVFHPS